MKLPIRLIGANKIEGMKSINASRWLTFLPDLGPNDSEIAKILSRTSYGLYVKEVILCT